MQIYGHTVQTLAVAGISSLLLLGCGSDRVNIEFKTSRQFYLDDSQTDPDKLNRELEHDIREVEKKRRQKQRAAEAAAKAKSEAEKKAKIEQEIREQETPEEDEPIQTP
jgi:outer membrane murein-binding lipoprotein Lpp